MHILIVKTSSMGDVIHTLPAIADTVQKFPDITIDWVVEENFAEIPTWHPAVNRAISIALRRWRKHPWQMLKQHEFKALRTKLRNKQYDFIIDAQGLFKSAAITMFAKGIRCGLNFKTAREPFASFAYQCKFNVPKNLHAITRVRQLFAKVLDYAVPNTPPNYGIKNHFSNKQSKHANNPYLVFIHAASRNQKCWPITSWQNLAHLAANQNYTIMLPWGNDAECEQATQIAASCPNAKVLPKLTLTEIASLLTNAKGVIAVDTGLGHLAAALDAPTVSLYGATDPNLIGTLGKNQIHCTSNTKKLANIDPTTIWDMLKNKFGIGVS